MIGAGIFSILGVVADISGSAMPLSFAIGASRGWFAAMATPRSARRSRVSVARYVPGAWLWRGCRLGFAEPVSVLQLHHLDRALRDRVCSVCRDLHALPSKVWAVGVVFAFTAINFLGARIMGRAESVIVITKVGILVALRRGGLRRAPPETDPHACRRRLWPVPWRSSPGPGSVRRLRGVRSDHECRG